MELACVAGVKRGGGRGGGREFGQKTEDQGGGGGGKRTPAIKTPIGSFLRSLAAAKFWLVNRTKGPVCEVQRIQPKWLSK